MLALVVAITAPSVACAQSGFDEALVARGIWYAAGDTAREFLRPLRGAAWTRSEDGLERRLGFLRRAAGRLDDAESLRGWCDALESMAIEVRRVRAEFQRQKQTLEAEFQDDLLAIGLERFAMIALHYPWGNDSGETEESRRRLERWERKAWGEVGEGAVDGVVSYGTLQDRLRELTDRYRELWRAHVAPRLADLDGHAARFANRTGLDSAALGFDERRGIAALEVRPGDPYAHGDVAWAAREATDAGIGLQGALAAVEAWRLTVGIEALAEDRRGFLAVGVGLARTHLPARWRAGDRSYPMVAAERLLPLVEAGFVASEPVASLSDLVACLRYAGDWKRAVEVTTEHEGSPADAALAEQIALVFALRHEWLHAIEWGDLRIEGRGQLSNDARVELDDAWRQAPGVVARFRVLVRDSRDYEVSADRLRVFEAEHRELRERLLLVHLEDRPSQSDEREADLLAIKRELTRRKRDGEDPAFLAVASLWVDLEEGRSALLEGRDLGDGSRSLSRVKQRRYVTRLNAALDEFEAVLEATAEDGDAFPACGVSARASCAWARARTAAILERYYRDYAAETGHDQSVRDAETRRLWCERALGVLSGELPGERAVVGVTWLARAERDVTQARAKQLGVGVDWPGSRR